MLAPVSSLSGGGKSDRPVVPDHPGTSRFRSAYSPRRSASSTFGWDIAAIALIALVLPGHFAGSASQAGGVRWQMLLPLPRSPASRRSQTADLHRSCGQHLPSGRPRSSRSIRADPVMLVLVVLFVQHIEGGTPSRLRSGDGSDKSLGRHRRDEDGSDLSRRIAEELRPADLPAPPRFISPPPTIDPMMDQGKLLFKSGRNPAEFRGTDVRDAQRKTGIQINVDATAVAQAGNGAGSLRQRGRQRDPTVHLRPGGFDRRADQSRRCGRPSARPLKDSVVLVWR